MSELINTQNKPANIRLGLLATTSAIVLAACVASVTEVNAADRPTLWIEGGWHFDNVTGSNETFVPPLDSLTTAGYPSEPTDANFLGQGSGGFPSFTDMENVLGRSSGVEGSISFQPKGSNWIFNVSARYGRTHSKRNIVQRKDIAGEPAYITYLSGIRNLKTPTHTNYVEQSADNTEAHTILDFKVGRDVGLGLFGERTESVLSFGARYVQMNTTSKGHSYAAPAVRFYHLKTHYFGGVKYYNAAFHQKSSSFLQRYSSLRALGPSLSWSNTTGLWGDVPDGQLAVDWGVNAALLFGRQKAKVHHDSAATNFHGTQTLHYTQLGTVNRTQSRRVIVPNLGGFAGLSYRFPNAKLSAGYRADFFFGAMDRGLDTRESVTTGFHGPYATISIGLGG